MADSLIRQSVEAFAEAAASKSPTPGGGSVSGVVGALAAAMGEMSLALTRGKKAFAEHEADYAHLAGRLEKARRMFLQFIDDDAEAFAMYNEAAAMDAGAEKDAAVDVALAAAINVPRETAKLALAAMEDMASLAGRCNPWLVSDLLAGATLAAAVCDLADFNVRINARNLKDAQARGDVLSASAADRRKAHGIAETLEKQLADLI